MMTRVYLVTICMIMLGIIGIPEPLAAQEEEVMVRFSSLYIIDDAEGGEGDWIIQCYVDKNQAFAPITQEAGTEESVEIEEIFSFTPRRTRFSVSCKIHEVDAGESEYVGEFYVVHKKKDGDWPWGDYTEEIQNDEGYVRLYYYIE